MCAWVNARLCDMIFSVTVALVCMRVNLPARNLLTLSFPMTAW